MPELEQLEQALAGVWRSHGLDFSGHKAGLLHSHAAARMAALQLERVQDYVRLVEASQRERSHLLAHLLVGHTRFFRDSEVFSALYQAWVERAARRGVATPLRAWTAGCATGEEAYSLAILLREADAELGLRRPIRLFATDIREEALAQARHGFYPASRVSQLSQQRLANFFVQEPTGFRVRRVLRDTILFARHDLLRNPPYARLDLITCRNVLVYHRQPAQRLILERFHFALRPGGLLLLGNTESSLAAEDLFASVDRHARLYVKRERLANGALVVMGRGSRFDCMPGAGGSP